MLQHGRRHVAADCLAHMGCERAHDQTAATGDIEHAMLRRHGAELNQQAQGIFIGDGLCRGEHHGLTGELINDPLVMRACSQLGLPG